MGRFLSPDPTGGHFEDPHELDYLLQLDCADFDVTITGFEVPEIDLILEEATAAQQPEDATPEPAFDQEPITKPGDLWLLGKHRIICGNSLHRATYLDLLGNRRAAAIFTDPPFNVRIDGHATGNGAIRHREFAMASGEMSEAEFIAFLNNTLRLLNDFSADGSVHYVCMDWRHLGELLAAGRQNYGELLNLCVWVKDNGGMGSFYRSQHELVMVFRKGGKGPHRNNVQLGQFGRNRTNVWRYPGVQTQSKQGDEGNLLALHPTVKPVALVADAILDCTARGEVVLDAFLGSGTTLIAAERVGRVCCCIEIDPLYADVAIRRWQKYTGETAVHSTSGKLLMNLQFSGRFDMHNQDPLYEVGYGKPPRQTQFQKGTSGNLKGRPKGSKNLANIVLKESRQPVRVNGPRGGRTVSKLEAAVMQLGNKSSQGDLRASRELFTLVQRVEESVTSVASPLSFSELDRQVIESMRRRMSSLQSADRKTE